MYGKLNEILMFVHVDVIGCMMQCESKTHISPLLTIESPVAQWLERGFESQLGLGFFPSSQWVLSTFSFHVCISFSQSLIRAVLN